MSQQIIRRNEELESIIESVRTHFKQSGFKTLRFSETNDKILTSEYDCLVIRGKNGIEYSIGFDKSTMINEFGTIGVPSNIIKKFTGL